MNIVAPRPDRRSESRGQILPLTVLMMVALIGIVGLAIDVSSAFSTQRFERAVTDAASLAGAQDLQKAGTRLSPGPLERANARSHAMALLAQQLKAPAQSTVCAEDATGACTSGSACVLPAGCRLWPTPYWVSIRTPSPSCIDCADRPELAVQVTVRNPSFGLTFSRLLGQSQWNVGATSVAAIDHARAYGLVTLRPPRPRNNCSNPTNCDQNDNTIDVTSNVNGTCNVTIVDGDIGTNSNMTVSNNAKVCLDPGSDHRVFYYDPYQKWTSPPPGFGIQTLIQDPLAAWLFPVRTGAPTPYASLAAAQDTTNCTIAQGGAGSAQAKVPDSYKVGAVLINDPAFTTLTCLKAGVYSFPPSLSGGSGNNNAYLLEPGVYWFDYGLGGGGTIIGGYDGGHPGVALVFNESKNDCPAGAPGGKCSFDGNNSPLVALNYGSAYLNPSGAFALAAQDFLRNNVETPAPHIPISLMVARESPLICIVQDPESPACASAEGGGSYDQTLNLPGGANLFLAGVQYAPNDNIKVSGNTANAGDIGELISWTITYTGNSTLNFHAALAERSGVLRLDRACSPGESVCNP